MPEKIPKVVLLVQESLVDIHFRVQLGAATELAEKVAAVDNGSGLSNGRGGAGKALLS